jgi:hypothetical protein
VFCYRSHLPSELCSNNLSHFKMVCNWTYCQQESKNINIFSLENLDLLSMTKVLPSKWRYNFLVRNERKPNTQM